MAKAEGRENLYGSFVAKKIEKTWKNSVNVHWSPVSAGSGQPLAFTLWDCWLANALLLSSVFGFFHVCFANGKELQWRSEARWRHEVGTDKICEHSTWVLELSTQLNLPRVYWPEPPNNWIQQVMSSLLELLRSAPRIISKDHKHLSLVCLSQREYEATRPSAISLHPFNLMINENGNLMSPQSSRTWCWHFWHLGKEHRHHSNLKPSLASIR